MSVPADAAPELPFGVDESLSDPVPPGTSAWTVFDAAGNAVARYSVQAAAANHILAWPALTYRQTS